MKKFLLIVFTVFAALGVFAQKSLSLQDITPELSVYPCQDRYEALVVIRCSEDFELEFKSNVDKELSVTRDQEGTEKIYNIVFKTRAEGTSFNGRVLSIIAPGFDKLYLPLKLKQKEKKEYLVTDPYSSLRSIYYTSIDKGNELFTLGMYDQALDQYRMAQRCPEYQEFPNNIDSYLVLCDSMKYWTEIVDSADIRGDYYTARDYLLKMMQKNTNCNSLKERYYNINQAYVARCNADMSNGELYMLDGYYDKAKALYENAIRMRNPRIGEAEARLHEIEKLTFKKNNKTRTFFYQYIANTPIAFTTAGCKPNETGGYFSMSFNKQCVDLLSNTNKLFTDQDPKLNYEAGVSAGWTIPIFESYVFAYFTPFSYVGGGFSTEADKEDDKTNKLPSSKDRNKFLSNQDVHWFHAIAPEAGIVLKYWRVAINYKYQYRYWFGQDEDIANRLGTTRHSIGVGFAW